MAHIQRQAAENTQTQTSTQNETRERMQLEGFLADIANPNTGEVVGKGLVLENASHLLATEEHKETYGGIIRQFVDPVSGKRSWFLNDRGEKIEAGCPVRIFDADAAALARSIGEPVGRDSQLLLKMEPGADAAVYRREDGTVAFLAVRLSAVVGGKIRPREIAELW